jgi:SAM-dependent methyltransferase
MHNFEYVQALIRNYKVTVIDNRISPNDQMNNQYYFEVGKSAVDNIALACLASNIIEVKKVLDIPCGHGRVLRHLIHLFPAAEFHACDVDVDGVDFCASNFGAKPVYSRAELTEVDFGSQYDLIWVGSLFTHTAQDVTRRWMSHLAKFLSPTGIVVATLHGRWSRYVHEMAPYIDEAQWRQILDDYFAAGYGYHDYLSHGLPHISGSYGVSLAKPHVTIRNVEDIAGTRIIFYRERGWVDHHDVLVFGRPSYDLP